MARKKVAFKVKTLIHDLSVLQGRFVTVLFDILYSDGSNSRALLRENREFMERLLADVDEILRLIEEGLSRQESR
jgi:hypothetical protein